jgi:hypothetical protein
MPRIATLDERYQSYNVEMAEVIDGRFWKPYESQSSAGGKAKPAPAPRADARVHAAARAGSPPRAMKG